MHRRRLHRNGHSRLHRGEDIVKLALWNGLADDDIRREVLGTVGIDDTSLADTVALVDSKETAARAMSAEGARVAASTHRKTGLGYDKSSSSTPGAEQILSKGPSSNALVASSRRSLGESAVGSGSSNPAGSAGRGRISDGIVHRRPTQSTARRQCSNTSRGQISRSKRYCRTRCCA